MNDNFSYSRILSLIGNKEKYKKGPILLSSLSTESRERPVSASPIFSLPAQFPYLASFSPMYTPTRVQVFVRLLTKGGFALKLGAFGREFYLAVMYVNKTKGDV